MFVNVSPAQENTGESKVSLEFGARTQKTELGSNQFLTTYPQLQRPSRPKNSSKGDLKDAVVDE